MRTSPRTLALAAAIALLLSCSGEERAERDRGRGDGATPYVEVVEAREGSLPLEERVSGVVRASNQVAIGAEISGPVIEVMVRNGERVREGQILARQDSSALREQLRESEASLEIARGAVLEQDARVAELDARLQRLRALAADDLVSQQEVESLASQKIAADAGAAQARARVRQAEAAAAERRRLLERSVVRAPISGTIGSRDVEVGMNVSPGDVLFVIGDLGELTVEVPLTESMLEYVAPGQRVRILSTRLPGGGVDATLDRISPFLSEGSFSTVGEIDLTNPDGRLQPGMFVQVDLFYGESERATLVPVSALWEDVESGALTVWVVEGEPQRDADSGVPSARVVRRDVDLVGEGKVAAAVGGIGPGERVVVLGQHMFRGTEGEAKLRSITWDRVAELQSLQRDDLLEEFLDKQQRLARTIGARPLTNEEFLGSSIPMDPKDVSSAEGF